MAMLSLLLRDFGIRSLLSQIPWASDVLLDVATQSPVWVDWEVKWMELKTADSLSLDDLTRNRVARSSSQPVRDMALRQIWQSTGFMILSCRPL
jgi:hypothetical protein